MRCGPRQVSQAAALHRAGWQRVDEQRHLRTKDYDLEVLGLESRRCYCLI